MFHIPKCHHLSIPEPLLNQILLTYFYLSEQFQKIQFELGDPVNYDQYFESLVFLDVGTIYTTASKNKYSIIKRKGGMFISVQLPSRVIVVSMIFWTI